MAAQVPTLKIKSENGKIKASVPCTAILSYVYEKNLPNATMPFKDIVKNLQAETKKIFRAHPQKPDEPTSSSFNNCNGRWAEYVFGAYAWNYLVNKNMHNKQNNDSIRYVYVKLPAKSSEEEAWTMLLKEDQLNELVQFQKQGSSQAIQFGHNAFRLSSSNPDAIILKFDESICIQCGFDPLKALDNLSEGNIELLDGVFYKLKKLVEIEHNFECFLSIKNSVRPDRRYQFVHEGDNVKAILMLLHYKLSLSNRVDVFCQNRFFAFSLNDVNSADEECMDTATAACISNPLAGCIWCVDKIFCCLRPDEIQNDMKVII